MSDGTPIDALDTGEVSSAADAQKMAAILSEMNSMGAVVASQQPAAPQYNAGPPMAAQMPPMQPAQPMPPMMMQPPPMYQQPHYQQHYVPVDEEQELPSKGKKKRNVWSSIMDRILDPIIVTFIVFIVSLPVLHTFIGKYASWAFAVGGQLSWFGLIALSVMSGLLFGTYRAISELF